MIARVRLTYAVDVTVKGESQEQIVEWMNRTSPTEAFKEASKSGYYVEENYGEEFICPVMENSDYDIDITKGGN